jgi:phosphatidylglycerophosphatase GEP4
MSQNFNLDAVLYFPWVRLIRKSLAIPHFSVKDISKISPQKVREYGFKGEVFDADNTLRVPRARVIYPTIARAFKEHQSVFGNSLAILSDSAGTKDDKDYEDALQIEKELGIFVLRHDRKKPGGIDAVLQYFGCEPEELVMFGDRILTDTIFGNRYGMLTVLTAPLTEEGESKLTAKIRKYELSLMRKWAEQGKTAPPHKNYHSDICLEKLF